MKRIKIVKAKDFDNDAFKWKKFRIIMRSPKSVLETLQFLSEQGYVWGWSKTSLLEDIGMKKILLERVKDVRVYICAGGAIPNGVLLDFDWLYASETVEIDFKEEHNMHTNNKIVITNDGKTTTATLYSNGKKAGIGAAICHDDDAFDIYAGAKLALERLEKHAKEAEMTDWEKFVKGEVNMRVLKKYIRSFLDRAAKDDLKFCGNMEYWYLEWLEQDSDSIIVSVNHKIKKCMILTEILRCDRSKTVDYIPGMK